MKNGGLWVFSYFVLGLELKRIEIVLPSGIGGR